MQTIRLGSLTIYPYGVALAVAALVCLLIMLAREKKELKPGTVSWFALTAPVLGVVFGRIGYFLVSIRWFLSRGAETFFQFTEGGYMLYGVMIGIVLAAFLTARITKQKTATVLDAAAAPFALFTALARGAEYFAGVGLGDYIEEWFDPEFGRTMFPTENYGFFLRFPFGVTDEYGDWRFAVFMLEAVAALVLAICLFRGTYRKSGTRALLFLGWYASLQTVLESLRLDLELRWGFVKVNQLLVLPALAIVTVCCVMRTRKELRTFRRFIGPVGGILGCCGIVMAMEFALERKIGFLTWMRMDLCWIVMGLAAITMGLFVRHMIIKSDLE